MPEVTLREMTKILGVIIDAKLLYKYHIPSTVTKPIIAAIALEKLPVDSKASFTTLIDTQSDQSKI